MDARTLGAAAGVEVGTLNAWIQRGYIRHITADSRGQRRDFNVPTATHIAVMAELSHFGFGAPWASFAAKSALECYQHGYPFCLVAQPIEEGREGEAGYRGDLHVLHFESEAKIPEVLAALPPEERPNVYLVIDTGRLIKKMQQTEKEWQQRREAQERR
jgi:hypothetical protein